MIDQSDTMLAASAGINERDLSQARNQAIQEVAVEIRQRGKSMMPCCVENLVPAKCALAIVLRAEGVPIRQIKKETNLSPATISRLSWKHSDTLENKRAALSRAFVEVADKARQAASEKLDMILGDEEQMKGARLNDLAITAGIFTEKASLLAGGPSAVVEHRTVGPTLQEAKDFIDKIRKRLADKNKAEAIECETVEVPAGGDFAI